MKIMVVDDERDVEMLFRLKFRKEIKAGKIELMFAFSGEEALQLLEQNPGTDLALILSDINMPGMNGLELLKRIKQEYRHLKVHMITAYGDQNFYNKAQEYGCDDYHTKPIDFDKLKKKLFDED